MSTLQLSWAGLTRLALFFDTTIKHPIADICKSVALRPCWELGIKFNASVRNCGMLHFTKTSVVTSERDVMNVFSMSAVLRTDRTGVYPRTRKEQRYACNENTDCQALFYVTSQQKWGVKWKSWNSHAAYRVSTFKWHNWRVNSPAVLLWHHTKTTFTPCRQCKSSV